jgi:hypothetical protein
VVPRIGWDGPGQPGVATFRIDGSAGVARLNLNLAIPRDQAPRRYEVRTSLQEVRGI